MPKKGRLETPLVLVTNRRLCAAERDLQSVVAGALEGGVDAVILREKDLEGKRLLELTEQLLALTRPAGAPLIINGNVAVAMAAGVDGVHLGAGDLPPSKARAIIGPAMLLGRSIHSAEEAQALVNAGEAHHLDYFLFGNVFETTCKPGKAGAGMTALTEVTRRSPIPVIAIGGITGGNAALIGRCGAAGVAVMSAIMAAANPAAAAKAIAVASAATAAADTLTPSAIAVTPTVAVATMVTTAGRPNKNGTRAGVTGPSGLLYGIIGREQAPDEATLAAMADAAYAGGCDLIQLREKNMSTGELLRRAQIVREIAARRGKLFIVNDRLDIAQAAGADGVHLGAEDLPPEVARRMWPGGLIGVTVRDIAQAQAAAAAGADYVGAGPVFPTTSKKLDADPLGVSGLQAICQAVDIPVIAIGGLTADRITGLQQTGCQGVAVISALFQAPVVQEPDRAAQFGTAVAQAARRLKSVLSQE
ncbi:thiamine phosphate synthase [Heliobacterium gestii]|uniref:Thiamine-phosphate synthase n=1 Tax=Heliomicrobium gestii TaxID=2699 RepID=A0A845LGW0_HELGE|nr:thiamine phosphate synthase [Heliomicrobium gestii]MBM7868510.1 thiamine-phosphate diphosphorylase [Heliomicrobium gestii]MZP44664.1 thiamine phosphate synthase [Heliomicrobium gestii]